MNTLNPLTELEHGIRQVERVLLVWLTHGLDAPTPHVSVPRDAVKELCEAMGLLAASVRAVARDLNRSDEILRKEWRARLETAVMRVPNLRRLVRVALVLDFFDVHELYTVLVDPSGEPESCCAGCTRLPPGWCPSCDEQRKAEN